MNTENFFYCENKSQLATGAGIIISTEQPFVMAKIFRFDSGQDMVRFLEKHNLQGRAGKVHGYNIVLAAVGTIDDYDASFKPVNGMMNLYDTSIINELKNMAEFYGNEKVKRHESRLKKYKDI